MRPQSSSAPRLTFLVFASFALALAVVVMPSASLSTYAALSVLFLALVIVTINTATNARPTGSLGQTLYETDNPATVAVHHDNRTKAAAVDPW